MLTALFLITVKTHGGFHAVVKKMQKTLVIFLYDGAKSHHITTLMHERLLAEIRMNEKPFALWCNSFSGGELGFIETPCMTQKDWTWRKCEVSDVAWLCSGAARASLISTVC